MIAKRKGEYFSIKINDKLVKKKMTNLQDSLIGKLSLASGDSPYSLDDLKLKSGTDMGALSGMGFDSIGERILTSNCQTLPTEIKFWTDVLRA